MYVTLRSSTCFEQHLAHPQPLVSSLCVNSRTVCRLRADCSPLSTCILYGCLKRVTIPEVVVIKFVLLRMSRVLLETSALNLHTVRLFTERDDPRGCSNTVCSPEDEQVAARNIRSQPAYCTAGYRE